MNFINLITHYQFPTFTSNSVFFLFISSSRVSEVLIHSNFFLLLMKKFTVIKRELKIIYTFTTHLQDQALDQLVIKLLFYGMTCRRHFNTLSHYQCLKIIQGVIYCQVYECFFYVYSYTATGH